MDQSTALSAVGHAIQLSVAPVFLLSAIGAMLAVTTNRLSRLVDRGRLIEARLADPEHPQTVDWHRELSVLSRRAKLINRAITLLTITALFVCAVIATLFVAAFRGWSAANPVALLFISAMATFIAGLLFFLREIFIATATLRIGPK